MLAGPYQYRDLAAYRQYPGKPFYPQNLGAAGINDAGQASGSCKFNVAGNNLRACIYNQAGGMQVLGTLSGTDNSYASSISYSNGKTTVVGTAQILNDPNNIIRAFVWDSQTQGMRELYGIPGSMWTEPHGVNNAGYIAGFSVVPVPSQDPNCPGCTMNQWHAYIWDPSGNIRNLPNLGIPASRPAGINNAGQVAGVTGVGSDINNWHFVPVVWSATGSISVLPSGPYVTGDPQPLGINDVGAVVGISGNTGVTYDDTGTITSVKYSKAILWTPTASGYVLQELGVLPGDTASVALAINNSGQVVGYSYYTDPVAGVTGTLRGFIWDGVRGMRSLDIPAVMVNGMGFSINKDGEIAGFVYDSNYQSHGLIWRRDADGDGLLDVWEERGYDSKHYDVVDVFLPAMGADKNHKDIFLQVDYMTAANHTHQPTAGALKILIDSFNNAPVSNPDGSTGIHLHIDAGPNTVMNPVNGATWGSLSKSNSLSHANVLGSLNLTSGYNWTKF